MTTCRYCQLPAALKRYGDAGYPYGRDYGPTWTCTPCAAWVGCHPGTEKPLGGLANAVLRVAKQAAHAAFDPLWQQKMAREGVPKWKARHAGYRWLSDQLGIPFKETHIGLFDLAQCRRVVEVCTNPSTRSEPMGLPPTTFTDEPYTHIELTPVTSNQVGAVGYDPATKTLAVTFARGTGAIYHYPNCEPKLHADFMAAESKGKFFGAHVKALPFKKFPSLADQELAARKAAAQAA